MRGLTAEVAPGTAIADPAAVPLEPGAAGATHFAVVTCAVRSLEWLYLSAAGHRRARFDFEADPPGATWLVP